MITPPQPTSIASELGKTVRQAIRSWGSTLRLCLIMITLGLLAALLSALPPTPQRRAKGEPIERSIALSAPAEASDQL
jgi:hypothetical protein